MRKIMDFYFKVGQIRAANCVKGGFSVKDPKNFVPVVRFYFHGMFWGAAAPPKKNLKWCACSHEVFFKKRGILE